MGFPDPFQVLDAVVQVNSGKARPNPSDLPPVKARKAAARGLARAVGKFKLFAFVLADPESHAEFSAAIDRDFEALDRSTGPDLLFFALSAPSAEWREQARARPYMRALSNNHVRKGLPVPRSSLEVQALVTSLGLSPGDLPCILVTTDLSSPRFRRLPTCKEHFQRQLEALAARAGAVPCGGGVVDPLDAVLQGLDLCGQADTHRRELGLAEALCEVLAACSLYSPQNEECLRIAEERVRESLRRIQQDVAARQPPAQRSLFGPPPGGEPDEDLLRQLERAVVLLASLGGRGSKSEPVGVAVIRSPEGVEPGSERLFETAKLVHAALARSDTDWDWSPLAICLSKAFETEADLSLGQWARNELSSDRPEYCKALDKDEFTVIIRDNFEVRVGKHAFMLGGLLAVIGKLTAHGRLVPVPQFEGGWSQHAAIWEKFRELRNRSAHTGQVDRGVADQMIGLHHTMLDNGGWPGLVALKRGMQAQLPGP